jgi:hypothetical protein
MPAETSTQHDHAALLATVIGALSTRSLNHFAAEARLDGESLQQAVERYEIDYAWHVLASVRLREATVARLEARLKQPASAAQQRCIAEVLHAAASAQEPELLMSYDNDVAEHLAEHLAAALN